MAEPARARGRGERVDFQALRERRRMAGNLVLLLVFVAAGGAAVLVLLSLLNR